MILKTPTVAPRSLCSKLLLCGVASGVAELSMPHAQTSAQKQFTMKTLETSARVFMIILGGTEEAIHSPDPAHRLESGDPSPKSLG